MGEISNHAALTTTYEGRSPFPYCYFTENRKLGRIWTKLGIFAWRGLACQRDAATVQNNTRFYTFNCALEERKYIGFYSRTVACTAQGLASSLGPALVSSADSCTDGEQTSAKQKRRSESFLSLWSIICANASPQSCAAHRSRIGFRRCNAIPCGKDGPLLRCTRRRRPSKG